MLEDPDIDVIYIGTPHGSHFPMAVAALEAGKHVLVEKPLGIDAAQARQLATWPSNAASSSWKPCG